jgi:hypothetical protein
MYPPPHIVKIALDVRTQCLSFQPCWRPVGHACHIRRRIHACEMRGGGYIHSSLAGGLLVTRVISGGGGYMHGIMHVI